MFSTLEAVIRNMHQRYVPDGEIRDALLDVRLDAVAVGADSIVRQTDELIAQMCRERVTKPVMLNLLKALELQLCPLTDEASRLPVFSH